MTESTVDCGGDFRLRTTVTFVLTYSSISTVSIIEQRVDWAEKFSEFNWPREITRCLSLSCSCLTPQSGRAWIRRKWGFPHPRQVAV